MYVKVFATILDSSVWSKPKSVRIVWITLLAMSDREGYVWASPSGLARRACLDMAEVTEAVTVLSDPDPEDSSGVEGGRRIIAFQGGWRIVNYARYRDMADADIRREQVRNAVRKHRAKASVIGGNLGKAQSESESESESEETEVLRTSPLSRPRTAAQGTRNGKLDQGITWDPEHGWAGITELDKMRWREAYPACDQKRQLAAADMWLRANPAKAHKKSWARFLANWLSRSQERGGDVATNRTTGGTHADQRRATRRATEFPEPPKPIRHL